MSSEPSVEQDEFDIPLGGLDLLTRISFERTHVEAAIAEVRFIPSDSDESLSEKNAVAVWVGLGGKDAFPVFERQSINIVSLTLTPDGADSSSKAQYGWMLATADRRTAVMLLPSTVIVQTSEYERFSTSLGDLLRSTLPLFAKATEVQVVQRIGLRYINRLDDPDAVTAKFWGDHIRPEFAGPLSGKLSHLIEATHQQTTIQLGPNVAAKLNSGTFPEQNSEGRFGFLIDLDVFREEAFLYEEALCSNLVRQLNRTAFSLFCSVLSDRYLLTLGPTMPGKE